MAVPSALPSSEGPARGDGGALSYVQIVSKVATPSAFKVPMRYPVDVDGEPGFVFTEPEMSKAADDFRFAIVLKFVWMRPTIDDIRLVIIKSWGLLEILTVSMMDDYHVLVKMQTERDFVHGWAREGRLIAGSVFRLFRWTKDFDLQKESTLAPQWIFLPGLPLHMYRADFLQILATRFGRFLGIDNATLHRTRAWGLECEVRYERPGFYCTKCCRQGHTSVVCRASEEVVRKGRDVAKGVGRKIWQEIPKQKSLQAVPGVGLKEVQKEDGVAMEVVNGKEVVVTRDETETIFRGERVNIEMKMVEEPCEEEEVVEQPSIQMLREVEVARGDGSDMDLILVDAYKSPRSGGRGQAAMVSAVLAMECHLQPVIVEEPPDSYGTDVEEEANVLDLAKNKGYDSDSVSQ
ncbi:hypothetical protein F2P56_035497 [Juglans regia]|uniref:Uncharacterized protein LOC108993458 n=2 Tax=Juglans regia TaxID=51240 RepID=A0A2I4EX07_JUGRE|nr:uncharacterized protein LOC108993458 [Juglans regia]KAF5442885.1 hypothetical protein F2P56_035497 [Juglans regia]